MKKIVIPKMGMATTEVDILTWKVKEGDHVKPGDIIVEIESEKATVTIESELNGVITKILYKDGDTVPVGEAICEVEESK
jgi:pyruvate/2-oxoglutarate dehydrogenase complex dihydrolipoamide acyltransferase (E2) component